ncbi:Arylsulfatase [Planctopirus ephydatiae]|uniref:Arylsulfatase n=2 Tax=Planctopirus ephydatiae TaxID=2528019 RepID=A0A518GP93_9PLAN|nr:Arylsulfatase [Planctopirus ephydatiae]
MNFLHPVSRVLSGGQHLLLVGLCLMEVLFAKGLLANQNSSTPQPTAEDRRPHLVLILADDMTYDAMSLFDRREVQTPHLDALARRGTFFTHAANMGSWSPAVCIASRSMLLTGRTLWKAEKSHKQLSHLASQELLWPQRLKKAGYRTFISGKWHLPVPPEKVFDQAVHIRPGMPADKPAGYNRPLEDTKDVWSASDPAFGGYWEGGTHWSEVLANDAEIFLGSQASAKSPFLMYLAFNAPHDPRQAPQEFLDQYPASNLKLPAPFLPRYPFAQAMGSPPSLRDERLAPFPRTEAAIKQHLKEYYALITHLDAQIGKILHAIESSGTHRETIIAFTADHGLAIGQHGLMGKQNLYDHSTRVPLFFVSIPAGSSAKSPHRETTIHEGKQVTRPVYLQSVAATFLDLAGVPLLPEEEYPSLLPLIRETTTINAATPQNFQNLRFAKETDSLSAKEWHDDLIGSYLHRQRSITSGGMKLILYPEANAERLYNLKTDPLEQTDLSANESHLETRKQLRERLIQWQKTLEDPLHLNGKDNASR